MKSNTEYKGYMECDYDGKKKKYSCIPIINIQVLFDENSDLETVKKQFAKIRKELEKEYVIQVHHCFTPRKFVEKEGLLTNIIDVIDEMFKGLKVFSPNTQFDTYEEMKIHLAESKRMVVSAVDKIYILDSKETNHIAEEMKFLSEGKINIVNSNRPEYYEIEFDVPMYNYTDENIIYDEDYINSIYKLIGETTNKCSHPTTFKYELSYINEVKKNENLSFKSIIYAHYRLKINDKKDEQYLDLNDKYISSFIANQINNDKKSMHKQITELGKSMYEMNCNYNISGGIRI